jgi:hypothetical protein
LFPPCFFSLGNEQTGIQGKKEREKKRENGRPNPVNVGGVGRGDMAPSQARSLHVHQLNLQKSQKNCVGDYISEERGTFFCIASVTLPLGAAML